MARTKKIQNTKQLDGRLDVKLDPASPHSLDQIMGEVVNSKYKQSNLEEYEQFIADLNITDLQKHAFSVGIIPGDDKIRLKKNLIAQFIKYSSYVSPQITASQHYSAKNGEIDKEALKVLREGA